MSIDYLSSATKQFEYYRTLGEKAMAQLADEALFASPFPGSNSIATLVQHLTGNMLSRFTDFLISDGEKEWRNRDAEFRLTFANRSELMNQWDMGWKCLLDTLASLNENHLQQIVYIRNEGHTVLEAINRQLSHYPYHVGQIVYIAKMHSGEDWESLSIPLNKSQEYNEEKFSQAKSKKHFTDNV